MNACAQISFLIALSNYTYVHSNSVAYPHLCAQSRLGWSRFAEAERYLKPRKSARLLFLVLIPLGKTYTMFSKVIEAGVGNTIAMIAFKNPQAFYGVLTYGLYLASFFLLMTILTAHSRVAPYAASAIRIAATWLDGAQHAFAGYKVRD